MNMLEYINKALVVAAHPDDEILGCGGAMARLREAGAEVTVLILGEGPTARETGDMLKEEKLAAQIARTSAIDAASTLGVYNVRFADLPDNRFDTVPLLHIVRAVEATAHEAQPDLVFTHFAGDLNIDHQLTHRAAMTAFRPLPGCKPVCILGFEVLSSTEYAPNGISERFHPTVYIDITGFIEAKQKALAAYASEMRPWPHPRSHEAIEHLACLRGSQCGIEAAEGFVLYRGIF